LGIFYGNEWDRMRIAPARGAICRMDRTRMSRDGIRAFRKVVTMGAFDRDDARTDRQARTGASNSTISSNARVVDTKYKNESV